MSGAARLERTAAGLAPWKVAAAITLAGLLVRLAALLAFVESPGDGPSRAALGYRWYLTGRASFYGLWLPGHQVMIGLALHLVPDPAWAGRLLSLAAGTGSIPLLHALTRRLFGPAAAVLAALALALNPMHAALSATSLGETVGLAALLVLLVAAFRLADAPDSVGALLAAALAALVGTSVRFELWVALPVVVLHHLARTRSPWRAGLLAAVLAPFPAIWLLERARIGSGGLGATYARAVSGLDTIGSGVLDAASGAASFGATLIALLGLPLLFLALLGAVALATDAPRPAAGRRADVAALLALLAAQGAFLAKLAADLNEWFWPRYATAEAALLLPLAAFALVACVRPRAVAAAAAVAGLAAMLHVAWARNLDLYLVREIPGPTREAAAWVERRPPDEVILLTRMGWQASYIPILARLPWERYRIISFWLPDRELAGFVGARRPRLVITRESDGALLDRLCRLTGVAPRPDRPPLARFGGISVLELGPGDCPPAPTAAAGST